jgi:hypothetical protein
MVYAGTKAMVQSGQYFELHPELRGQDTPFDEESFARDELAAFWESKPQEIQGTDPYLHILANVRQAGLIRDYVWRYLRQDDWREPAGIDAARLDEFLAQRDIKDHEVLTLGSSTAA